MTRRAVSEQALAVGKDMTRLNGRVDAEYLKRAMRGAQDGLTEHSKLSGGQDGGCWA
jgi:hypothetical protein